MPDKSKEFKRCAGVLLAVSSLPSNYGIGTLGKEAYRFIDFLREAGQSYWQVLPVGPTSYGDSPYQSFSAFAGNPYFIDLDILVEEGLLRKEEIDSFDWGQNETYVDYAKIFESRYKVLHLAFSRSHHAATAEFQNFRTENQIWLKDYSLYMAVKCYFKNKEWLLWPQGIRFREEKAVKEYSEKLAQEIEFWEFCQYKFFEQWFRVKEYANQNGIQIIGDIPIYVSLDSADVWTNSQLFQMDEERHPTYVAGVPPDVFSKTGQLWGNPLYDWGTMEHTDFLWWKQRMEMCAKIYDVIRIDHFIGIVRYYSICAGETNAVNGEWKAGPGYKLIQAINSAIGNSKVIAEDLGVVVPAVRRILKKSGYPGMKVLQFAFDSDSSNEHLPCHYHQNTVVYGGTHDNETLVGHFKTTKEKELDFAKRYLNVKRRTEIPKAILRVGYASAANTVIFQAQDILFLPNTARMNFPSTLGGNWRWRLSREQLGQETAQMLCELAEIYGRLPKKAKISDKGRINK